MFWGKRWGKETIKAVRDLGRELRKCNNTEALEGKISRGCSYSQCQMLWVFILFLFSQRVYFFKGISIANMGSDSQSQDQELHVLQTELARHPYGFLNDAILLKEFML